VLGLLFTHREFHFPHDARKKPREKTFDLDRVGFAPDVDFFAAARDDVHDRSGALLSGDSALVHGVSAAVFLAARADGVVRQRGIRSARIQSDPQRFNPIRKDSTRSAKIQPDPQRFNPIRKDSTRSAKIQPDPITFWFTVTNLST
jgi:hypothetical protein